MVNVNFEMLDPTALRVIPDGPSIVISQSINIKSDSNISIFSREKVFKGSNAFLKKTKQKTEIFSICQVPTCASCGMPHCHAS